ncbi:hypothetical protein K8Z49_19530 [Actinomadura madurae]|uniref:SurA N-terminal domain-containing protein n=1 Tax=Actinomadura madurae TaxID=1993 RepID=A0A1I5D092_9ACTN|nr:hypothetical protein [Actinomadura madurae]SFN92639.1 hypothetical protein SAMN04489713_103451 [Actinomadura madurae]
MPGKSVKAAVAAVVAAAALAGCGGSPKVGTAALVGDDRITVTTLSQTVRDWRTQFRADPAANELRANPANPAPQLAGDSESDLQGALTLLINFRVAREVAEQAGVEVTGGQVDGAVQALDRQGGAGAITLASGLPRAHTRDLARLVATQLAVMQRFGADMDNRLSPATQQAGRQWNELFQRTARAMDIEVNPRYGSYDPAKFEVAPVVYRLSSPDSGI